MLGTDEHVYFVCWEGATASQGVAYVEELNGAPSRPRLGRELNSCICPIQSVPIPIDIRKSIRLPFTSSYPILSAPSTRANARRAAETSIQQRQQQYLQQHSTTQSDDSTGGVFYEGGFIDEIVVDALESISGLSYRESELREKITSAISLTSVSHSSPPLSRQQRRFSYREKSERLLRQCSSWNQLEKSMDNQMLFEGQGKQVFLILKTTTIHLSYRQEFGQIPNRLTNFVSRSLL